MVTITTTICSSTTSSREGSLALHAANQASKYARHQVKPFPLIIHDVEVIFNRVAIPNAARDLEPEPPVMLVPVPASKQVSVDVVFIDKVNTVPVALTNTTVVPIGKATGEVPVVFPGIVIVRVAVE
jgi:hypothetical protein